VRNFSTALTMQGERFAHVTTILCKARAFDRYILVELYKRVFFKLNLILSIFDGELARTYSATSAKRLLLRNELGIASVDWEFVHQPLDETGA
jgi:hypothetical protein